MSDLTAFLLARLDEDEAAARAVPPLEHNYDMGGNRQDERFTFGRTLPSSMDGMGNWSPHRDSPTTRAHFERHNPARVLADVQAKRAIVDEAAEVVGLNEGTAVWMMASAHATRTLRHLAAIYADHPDYREEWRP